MKDKKIKKMNKEAIRAIGHYIGTTEGRLKLKNYPNETIVPVYKDTPINEIEKLCNKYEKVLVAIWNPESKNEKFKFFYWVN